MPVTLTVNNLPFEYPIPGDSPGWGQGASGWAEEVTIVLNSLLGPNDIAQTIANINNNQTSPINVGGLVFNTGSVRSAIIEYSIYRTSTANPTGNAESGTINIVYDNLAGSGSKWAQTVTNVTGNAGVYFTITDGGQVQYTSTDINSTGYSGNMHFRARSLVQ